jgi:hypothetical protein
MITTMAALMGTLPIALGLGAGAEGRRPLGLAVVGGLVLSQFLTLLSITPVVCIAMESLQGKLRKLFQGWRSRPVAPAPEAKGLVTASLKKPQLLKPTENKAFPKLLRPLRSLTFPFDRAPAGSVDTNGMQAYYAGIMHASI